MAAAWGAIIGAGLNLVSGMMGKQGQQQANELNLQIAREQMAFQREMSGTAYQRAAKDLDAAGLNRILALGSPATTPAGARATMLNEDAPLAAGIQSGVSTALDAMRVKNETQATQAQIRQMDATTENIRAQTNTEQETLRLRAAQRANEITRNAGIRTDNERKILDKQIRELEIPGVESAKDFYQWLLASPSANVNYHLTKVYGGSNLGLLQKWLIQLSETDRQDFNDALSGPRIRN